jgi:hypothetical protein
MIGLPTYRLVLRSKSGATGSANVHPRRRQTANRMDMWEFLSDVEFTHAMMTPSHFSSMGSGPVGSAAARSASKYSAIQSRLEFPSFTIHEPCTPMASARITVQFLAPLSKKRYGIRRETIHICYISLERRNEEKQPSGLFPLQPIDLRECS